MVVDAQALMLPQSSLYPFDVKSGFRALSGYYGSVGVGIVTRRHQGFGETVRTRGIFDRKYRPLAAVSLEGSDADN